MSLTLSYPLLLRASEMVPRGILLKEECCCVLRGDHKPLEGNKGKAR